MEFLVLVLTAFSGYHSCKFARILYADGHWVSAILVCFIIGFAAALLGNGLSSALRQ